MCLLRDYGLVTNRYKRFRLFLRIISAVGRAHDRLLFPVCLTPYNPLSFLSRYVDQAVCVKSLMYNSIARTYR